MGNLMNGKKGALSNGQTWGVIIVVGLLAIQLLGLYDFRTLFAATGAPIGTTPTTTTTTSGVCSDNPAIDLSFISRDALTASVTYRPVSTLLVQDKTNNIITTLSNVGGASTASTSTSAFNCGNEYALYIQSNESTVGAKVAEFTASPNVDPKVLSTSYARYGNLSVRLFDEQENAYMFVNIDTQNEAKGQNSYIVLNATGVIWDSATNATARTYNADDTLKLKIEVKTTDADKQFGIRNFVCFNIADDTNANDWAEPTVKFNGNTLTDVKGTMESNDILAVNAYEYCYDLGKAVGESSEYVNWEMRTGAGVNPDFDPSFKFLSAIIYQNDEDPNKIIGADKTVFFRTDSARTEAGVDEGQVGTVNIA